jgi:DNA-binding beta-propeller fold protein YncE
MGGWFGVLNRGKSGGHMMRLWQGALLAVTICTAAVVAVASDATAATPVPTYAGSVGGGTAGHASMYPSGVTVGPDGTVYVADTGNDQVKAYKPGGALAWAIGSRGTKAVGNFNNPRDIAYLNGKLYVDDTGNNRVQVVDTVTHGVTAWTFRFPSTIGISAGKDSAGNPIILVAEDANNAIAVFNTNGTQRCTINIGPVVIKNKSTIAAPRDAATNAAGDIYVAVYQQDRINEYPPVNGNTCPTDGRMIRTWGTHGSANDQLIRPYGVDLDTAGNVYVADSDNDRVQEFSATGAYKATFGAKLGSGGDLFQLRRVAVQGSNVYAADLWGFHVDRFSKPGPTRAQVFGNTPPANGKFNEPSGITFDGAGNLYVADAVNQRVQKFAAGATGASFTFSKAFGARGWGDSDLSGFNWPRDLTYAASTNTIWVADTKNNRLLEFTTAGASAGRFVGSASTMHWPWGIDADGSKLVIADTFKNTVESWNPNNTLNWSTSTAGGANFANPYDVAVSGGSVYVADELNRRIVKLSAATGTYQSSFGTGQLHAPEGVAVDPKSGNIWVADTSFNRVVEFTAAGTFIQAVGNAGSGDLQFNHPLHLEVHVDKTGHAYLYVTDVFNDRIEILDLHE